MRNLALPLIVLLSAPLCQAQDQQLPSQSLRKGNWDLGVFGGAGNGLGESTGFQFVMAGVRAGRILTAERGRGWIRGNFEWAVDFIPVQFVFPGDETVYAAEIRPVVWKWNFTSGRKIAPFAEIGAGLLFTNKDFPRPATINFNFTPQTAAGLQIFGRGNRALTLGVRFVHISNAGLSSPNPGINASVIFTAGYHWFR